MRNGELIYYCHKLSQPDANGEEFAKPVAVRLRLRYFTVNESTGNSFIDKYGLNMSKQQIALAYPYEFWNGKISVNDVFYINGLAPNSNENFYGQKANYRVTNIAFNNQTIEYKLENISNESN